MREGVTALFDICLVVRGAKYFFIFFKKVSQYFAHDVLSYGCAAGWRYQFDDENLLKGV